jgi:hypothetical protein
VRHRDEKRGESLRSFLVYHTALHFPIFHYYVFLRQNKNQSKEYRKLDVESLIYFQMSGKVMSELSK